MAQPLPPPIQSALELVPQGASGALLFDVAAAREAQHGPEVMAALLRLAEIERWEQILEIDVERDARQVVLHARIDRESGSTADLTRLLRRWSSESMGLVIELNSTIDRPLGECRDEDLARAIFEPVDGPLPFSHVARCGRYVLTSCCVEQPAPPTRSDSPVGRALSRMPEPAPGQTRLLRVVAGPEALNRATCSGEVIGLTGWHAASVEAGVGLSINSWIHAATPAEAPLLRQCIADQLAELAAFPLVSQLGIGDILEAARVERSLADDKDVEVSFSLDEQQADLLLGLVGALDSGGLP